MSKSVKVRLDSRTGQILEQLNEGIDTENAFITGTRIITVPQNVLRRSLGRSDSFDYDIDPRTEQEIVMQSQSSGTGGSTLGIEGDGVFIWNDVVRSNVTRVTTAVGETTPVYSTNIKKFGTSSIRFPTVGSGTGGVLIIPNDAPGLSLGGRGHHIGGGSGPVTGVSAGFSGDVLFNVHIYPISNATSEEVIVAQGSTSGGNTGQSFKLYRDSSNNIKFDFNAQADGSASFTRTLTVAANTGVTANQFHHIAILYRSRMGGSNASQVIPYFNGASSDGLAGFANDLLKSNEPITVGGLKDGGKPFNGLVDDLFINMGPSGGTVAAGHTGPTITVPTVGATVDPQSTLFLLNFDGPSGASNFYVRNFEETSALVTGFSRGGDSTPVLGVRDIITTGYATGGFNPAHGFLENGGGAVYAIGSTSDILIDLDEKKALKIDQLSTAAENYVNLVTMSGNSGGSGDFPTLYGNHGSIAGGHGDPRFIGNDAEGFALRPNIGTLDKLSKLATNILISGGTASFTNTNFTLIDDNGNQIGLSAGHVVSAYKDMFTFRQNLEEDLDINITEVINTSGNSGEGFSSISIKGLSASKILDVEENQSIKGFSQKGVGAVGAGTTAAFVTGKSKSLSVSGEKIVVSRLDLTVSSVLSFGGGG